MPSTAPTSLAARIEAAFTAVAIRPIVAGSAVFVVAFLLAALGSAAQGFPLPTLHDEFSILLGAETFLKGRLANPPHPMWEHFETFHVLQQPTYASKFPPGNALFIAFGWAISGHPIVGVWVAFAFMCWAAHWMLTAWSGPKWSLGVAIAFASWMAVSYWSYSYWGGSVAAGGGCLLFGGLYRIVEERGKSFDAVMLGLGLVLLANSRPYEGVLVALPAAAFLLVWFIRDDRRSGTERVQQILVPMFAVGIAGVAAMCIYNSAVTGHWYELPHTAYRKLRDPTPVFIWQQPARMPPARDATIRAFNAWQDSSYHRAMTIGNRVGYLNFLVRDFLMAIVPRTLLLPLLLLPVAFRERPMRFALIVSAVAVVGMGMTSYVNAHYAAPLIGIVLVIYVGCLRWLARLENDGQRAGRVLAVGVICAWFAFGIARNGGMLFNAMRHPLAAADRPWPEQRASIADSLAKAAGQSLVLVRYGPVHSPHFEWVYNAADIDASPVVWARDMGDSANRPLLEYYRNRRAFRVQVNGEKGPFMLTPYPTPRP